MKKPKKLLFRTYNVSTLHITYFLVKILKTKEPLTIFPFIRDPPPHGYSVGSWCLRSEHLVQFTPFFLYSSISDDSIK